MQDLPNSIWISGQGIMKIPPPVCISYAAVIKHSNLFEAATGPRPDPAPVGGISQELTDLHFAHAFDGSVARAQLALIDPHNDVPITSATLLRFLSGGTLCLTDVPCGAGAASLALLGSVAQLRREQYLPRVPLYVHIVGGEISAPARAYADQLLTAILPDLEEEAIFATFELCDWDVLSPVSNSELIERIILSKATSLQTLVVVCNFNGFLERAGKKNEARPQLAELFRFCSGGTNAAVWIEPKMNAATSGLFPWLKNLFPRWSAFLRFLGSQENDETSECNYELPLKAPSTAVARLAVLPIDLVKE
ncbi:MAG TPA: hypothetical protein VEA61_04165 [Allosphingosinicella sp.]|nr:hypothetical protein [Allosphingosinicella sp.]